jgi:hypothetical protein
MPPVPSGAKSIFQVRGVVTIASLINTEFRAGPCIDRCAHNLSAPSAHRANFIGVAQPRKPYGDALSLAALLFGNSQQSPSAPTPLLDMYPTHRGCRLDFWEQKSGDFPQSTRNDAPFDLIGQPCEGGLGFTIPVPGESNLSHSAALYGVN